MIQLEHIGDLWADLEPLIAAHYAETTAHPSVPVAPDRQRFAALDAADILRCFTARIEGRLVAYMGFTLLPDLHCPSVLQALMFTAYVQPEHRSGLLTMRLLCRCIAELDAEGAHEIVCVAKVRSGFGRLLAHVGFTLEEYVYHRSMAARS